MEEEEEQRCHSGQADKDGRRRLTAGEFLLYLNISTSTPLHLRVNTVLYTPLHVNLQTC